MGTKPIVFGGVTYTFPDDATDDEIMETLGSFEAPDTTGSVAPEPEALPVGVQPLPVGLVEAPETVQSSLSVEEAVEQAVEASKTGEDARTPEQQAQLEELTRLQTGREAGALVSPGGRVDLPSGEPGDGPSRAQMLYNLFEDTQLNVDDIFTRRPVMTAEALARAQAKASLEGEESYADYLPDAMRFSLAGVETPLGAGVRVIGDSVAAAVEVAARHALAYEVDEAGEPVDPDSFAYQAEQLGRSVLGDENYPTSLSTGGLGGPIAKVVESTIGYDFSSDLRAGLQDLGVPPTIVGFVSEGITMPAFGPVDHGSEAAQEMDPYGFRVADPNMDWRDQIVQNATVGRTLKDLFVDMPELREVYKERYGSESAAFYGGILADLMIPDLTFVGGKVAKGVKAAGSVADVGLTALAGSRLVGGRAMREALLQGAETGGRYPRLQMAGDATKAATRGTARTGDEAIEALGEVVAREAVGPRALVDAAEIAGEEAGDLVRLAQQVAPGSKSALWVAKKAEQVGLNQAFSEMRIAQGVSDIERVFDATIKATDDLLKARQAATRVARALGGGSVPASMAGAIEGASTARQLRKAVDLVVPANKSVLDIGRAGTGSALRAILNKADEALEGVGAVEGRARVAEMTRKALGEMVPRDMVAVTSRVMIPRRIADAMRKVVDKDLAGTIEQSGEGFRVVADKIKPTLAAIERMFPVNLRSDFWDGLSDAVRPGRDLRPDQVSRLTEALQSDAYLRLARDPTTGRALGEGLANIGKELDAAVGTTLQRVAARNIASRVMGAFGGNAKGAPAVYQEMGRIIGKETFGVPKRVADALRASRKAGDPDPFLKVGQDLAAKAGRLSDNFIEEAWTNTLSPLYGPLAPVLRRNAEVRRIMGSVPSSEGLRRVDEIAQGLYSESVRELAPKDFGSALVNGLFEAEGWVTVRNVAQRFIEDNPGMDLSMTPGLRGLDPTQAKAMASRAMADIIAQGTTYAHAPGLDGIMDLTLAGTEGVVMRGADEAFQYQAVLDSVGEALRAYGVKYLDEGMDGREVANRLLDQPQSWLQVPEELNALLLIPQGDLVLRKAQELDGLMNLAEAAEVVMRAKNPMGKDTFTATFGIINDFVRAGADLISMNEPTRLVKATFGPAIAVLAKQGVLKALETSFPATKVLAKQGGLKALETLGFDTSPIRRLGKTLDDTLFEASGRPWSQRQVNEEVSRLGVGASTRLSSARRGRLASDLLADLGVTMEGNKALGGPQRAAQYASRLGRMLPSMVDKVEQAFRREVFTIALKEGRTPERAAEIARDAVLDFEPVGTGRAARLLQPLVASGATAVAGLESMLTRPQETMRILRGMRAKQDYVQRTYGTDEELTGFEVPLGMGRLNMYGPSAAAYTAGLAADVYYKGADMEMIEDAGKAIVGGSGPARALGMLSGGIQTWIEGEPTELTNDDEVLQVMLMASLAERGYTDPTGLSPLQPWDVLVERYGLEATNVDPKEGGIIPIKIGRPARFGKGPREIEASYTYKMTPEGRKQFKKDMEWARTLGADPLLEAYKMYGVQPELGVATGGMTELEVAERRMGEEVRKATGR